MKQRGWGRLDSDPIISRARKIGDPDWAKGLVEPPVPSRGGNRTSITGDSVEVGALDRDSQIGRDLALDRKPVTGLEAAVRRKLFRDELILELHGAIPRVALETVFLPDELVSLVKVDVRFGLTAGGN